MKKEIIEVPVLSAAVRALGVPLSLVTKGAGLTAPGGVCCLWPPAPPSAPPRGEGGRDAAG